MYKLLVVDDEYNIRDGIVNAVPWETCGVVVAGEADNGITALEKVEETSPDIVITDIHMDDMDGLEFAEILKQKNPNIKVIILSGYDEFEYAKRALQLKVFSYLLKPVLPDELIKVVGEVIRDMEAEARLEEKVKRLESEIKINRQVLLERLLSDLVNGNIRKRDKLTERLALVGIQMEQRLYTCLIFDLDGYYDIIETHGIEKVHIILQCIQEAINEVFLKEFDIWSFIDSAGNIISILGSEPEKRERNPGNMHSCVEKLKQAIKSTLNVTITVAVGGTYGDILEMFKSYAEAGKALDFKMVAGRDCVIHIDDVCSIGGKRFSYPKDKENGILESLDEDDDEAIRDSIASFFVDLGSGFMKEHVSISMIELFAAIARKFMDCGDDVHKLHERDLADLYKAVERFDTVEEIKNWFTDIVIEYAREFRKDRLNNVRSVINKAQGYIDANFASPDLSLNSIAGHIYLNPAYFSKLYKKETGETYMDYLTRLRIEKAKSLLRETSVRASDIGAAVGYPNSQYFTTLFRKVTGKTPVVYREGK